MGNCLCAEHSRPVTYSARVSNPPLALFWGEEQKGARTSSNAGFPVKIEDVEDFRQMPGYGSVIVFTYSELRHATKNFRPDLILGEGGFGLVYKGVIDDNIRPGFEHTQVAIKMLNREGLQGDKEWLAEINYLGNLSHPNLVKLIGYCCKDEHRLLVYEHMVNASLENHLFGGNNGLPWLTRLKIALDAAKGLAFLHEAERPIIYRDFKTSNILLDAEYNGKLSDFGLAKEGPMGEQTHVSTRVMGTFGYAAPEYILTGHLTAKSDVYSFGVVLLELLFGRRSLDDSRHRNLVDWARPLLIRSNKLFQTIDLRMDGQYTPDNLFKVARLAYDSLSQNPKVRPHMSEVVDILGQVLKNEQFLVPSMPQAAAVGPAVTGATTPPWSRSPEARMEDVEINGRRRSIPSNEGSGSCRGSSFRLTKRTSFANHGDMPKMAQLPVPSSSQAAMVTMPPRSQSLHEVRRETRSPSPHEARRETLSQSPQEPRREARSPSLHRVRRQARPPSPHEDRREARSPSPHEARREARSPSPQEARREARPPSPQEARREARLPSPQEARSKNAEIKGRRIWPLGVQRIRSGGNDQLTRDLSTFNLKEARI